MKILILGAGQVGASVAENLASDANDITVVDLDDSLLKQLQERLDIQTISGNAAHPSILENAGAEDSDMLLALTKNDETNIIACKLASDLFNIPTKIARVRAADYMEYGNKKSLDFFDVDTTICPEQIVTNNIFQLIEYPGALQVLSFANGCAQMIVVKALKGGGIVGKSLKIINAEIPKIEFRISAIYRNDKLVIPNGDTVVEEGDEVFLISARKNIHTILKELRKDEKPIKRVMIAGGGNIGYRLAKCLEDKYDVKIIEKKEDRCEWLTEQLSHSLVLKGEATEEDLLEDENVDEMDVFIAITNDDEDNIMSSLLAKRLGARSVISLVNRTSYVDLLQGNKIDVVISPHLSTIGSLLAYIRRGDIEAVHPLRRGAAEAIEAVVHGDKKTSRVANRRIDEIQLPQDCYISAIVRKDIVLMAHHDLIIESGDHIIIFVARRRQAKLVEQLLEVKIGFF